MTDDVNAARERLIAAALPLIPLAARRGRQVDRTIPTVFFDLWTSPEHRDDLLSVLGCSVETWNELSQRAEGAAMWKAQTRSERERAQRAGAERDEAIALLRDAFNMEETPQSWHRRVDAWLERHDSR